MGGRNVMLMTFLALRVGHALHLLKKEDVPKVAKWQERTKK
jgi:hypothetical protein